jgi:CheY-like chemotaxis protein
MGTSLPTLRPSPLLLLCEPDADTRDLYRHSAIPSYWRIAEAEDGRDALAKAFSQFPQLVLTETRLPLLDGYTLCRLLRGDPLTKDIPILMVTADAYPAHVERALAAGADRVIVKPCLPDNLLQEMERLRTQATDLRSRAAAGRERGAQQRAASADLLWRSITTAEETPPRTKSRSHARYVTTNPSLPPPALRCLECDRPLQYTRSHIGGVSVRETEQWDYYTCPGGCGVFQYRQRTRKIRQVE